MKYAIKDLLVKLQGQNVLSEADVTKIEADFSVKLKEYKEQVLSENSKTDSDYAEKLEGLLESVDIDSAKKLQKIVDIYEAKIENIDDEVTAKTEKLIEAIDSDSTAKLEKIVEAIDTDSTKKVEQIIEAIDTDTTSKTEKLIEKLQGGTNAVLEENVSAFLDTYLEEKLPAETIVESVKMKKMTDALNEMKKILCVSDEYIQEEVKEAILEAKTELDAKDDKINELMEEKIELNKKQSLVEANSLLEGKTVGMDFKTKSYLEARFETSSVTEINEDFEAAKAAFKKSEAKRLDEARNANPSMINETITKPNTNYGAMNESSDAIMDMYAGFINKTDKK